MISLSASGTTLPANSDIRDFPGEAGPLLVSGIGTPGCSTGSGYYGYALNIGDGSRSAYIGKPQTAKAVSDRNIGDVDTALRGEDPVTRPSRARSREAVRQYTLTLKTAERRSAMTTFVLSVKGEKLMPTTNIKKIRKLLRSGRAKIVEHMPFTVQLLYESGNDVQSIEFTEDTGYQHIGVSLKSEKHEYVSAEFTLLKDEKQRHDDQRREHRRPRRSRKRYRKARFDNRKKPEGWLAPSLRNKADRHVDIFRMYYEVCPITKVTLEMGQFDPAVLDAVEQGKPVPEGTDYQHGPRYGYDTLREAVFARDGYRCLCCGKSAIDDGIILRLHHVGFRTGDRSNRLANLASVCEKCHIPKNHKPGGKLWDLKPPKGTSSAAYMNTVKWHIFEEIKVFGIETHITYGAVTKRTRRDLNIEKSHANDAYCIGSMRPKHRTKTLCFEKRRRNNRILEKFYDAKYVDLRDGKTKKAAELGCNRTNRSVPRNNPHNERRYRGPKVSKGRRSIRTQRYPYQPGDVVIYDGRKRVVKGTHNKGASVQLAGGGDVSPKKLVLHHHVGGWRQVV